MKDEIECKKCGEVCIIDGDYPKFDAWCDTCHTYAEGFDCLEYAAEYLADKIDAARDRMKDEAITRGR